MADNAKPFELDQQSIDNLSVAPSLSKEYPETGYNFQDTAFLANQLCQTHDNCAFIDTKEVLLSKSYKDMYKYIKNSINGKSNVVTGEIFINKDSGMLMLAPILAHAVAYDTEKIVCPLNLTYEPKESHAVAFCMNKNNDETYNAVILEQHTQNKAKDKEEYKPELDYSEEISELLNSISSTFDGLIVNTKYNEKPICREEKVCGIVSMEACKRLLEADDPVALAEEGFSLTADDVKKLHNQNVQNYQNYIVDTIAEKIINGLPEWNYSGAKDNSTIQDEIKTFEQEMSKLKEKKFVNDISTLEAIDYCIAKYVPDEHVSVMIKGENDRAGKKLIENDKEVAYKIPPPKNNNNLATQSDGDEEFAKKEFAEFKLDTLVSPRDNNKKSNILVATKEQNGQKIGVIAIDSFMIEMADKETRDRVDEIADYVLQQSKNWNSIIFDFRDNGGGDSSIIKQIGERLSAKKLEYADKIEVINKESDKSTSDKSNDGPPDVYEQKDNNETFTGDIYVLQDGRNASATEGAIWMLRQMKNCTTIGDCTHGAFAGGDVKSHEIGDTVVLKLGNTYRERYMPDRQKVLEGKGIPADIPCPSSKSFEKTLACIHDKQIKSLRGIGTKNHETRQVPKAPPMQHKYIKQTLINKSLSKEK